MNVPPNAQWTALFHAAGRSVDASQHDRLHRYLDLLTAGNEKMNLTRITDRAQAELFHIADALTLLPYFPPEEFKLADVGSGGGVPGIPLAIARPDAYVVLIESTKKKADFLSYAVAELGLTNVTISPIRGEEAARTGKRASFDVVTARAVGALAFLVEYCLPLVRTGGKMLAMKGPRHAQELPEAEIAIRLLGGGQPIVHPVELPGTTGHVIVEIAKIRKTQDRYPRPPSQQKGKPLG